MREGATTVAMSIVFSMPPGTDREKFACAMTDYAQAYFGDKGFDYLMAFHNDTKHPHCHMLLRCRNMQTLRKWRPGKQDLRDMREAMAEKMQEYGLSAVAISSRLQGRMASENRDITHKDMREMMRAMVNSGMKPEDVKSLLSSKYKSGLEPEMNAMDIMSNRQRNLSASVQRALNNPDSEKNMERFYEARLHEREALLEVIANIAKDIVKMHPVEAGLLIKYANELPNPKPEVLKLVEVFRQQLAQER